MTLQPDQWKSTIEDAVEAMGGKLDVIVNNAGLPLRFFTLLHGQPMICQRVPEILRGCICSNNSLLPQPYITRSPRSPQRGCCHDSSSYESPNQALHIAWASNSSTATLQV